MSSLWSSTASDSGILRKNDSKDRTEELLVFGYACKLFRDDTKALEIDQGRHLIPWMADNSLKIDRYDGRGALSDLSPFESSKEGFDAMRWLGLSESDRKLEQLCDEERYYALNSNEDEEELYKEEQLKRLQSNQIQYNYEEPPKTEGPTLPTEEDDEPFVPTPELDLPIGMVLPKTVKQNARIEKTALFISKEGPQMEILLKTKQSGNPQFGFLNQDNELWRYYRHILMAIKTGRYKTLIEKNKPEPDLPKEETHYLHPSLASESLQSVQFPPVHFKPTENCAYSQLIQRIQGTHTEPTTEVGTNIQYMQYQQYYYDYYGQYHATQSSTTNPYAQIVSNLKVTNESEHAQKPLPSTVAKTQHEPTKKVFSLAEYSDSENDDNNDDTNHTNDDSQAVVVPPNDIQTIIDKMAAYVAKNGADFEAIVKSKGDPRFVFLEPNHLYFPYYKYKLKQSENKKNKEEDKPEVVEQTNVKPEDPKPAKIKEKKIISPVSFSIKKPPTSTEQVTRDRSVLPVEDSTDDEEQMKTEPETAATQPADSQSDVSGTETQIKNDNEQVIEIEDPIMELIDLTDEMDEKKDKRAEDRLKDKIASVAREKMAEKNRALQLERKKRAAAFLSQLRPSNSEEIRMISSTAAEKTESITTLDIPEEFTRLVYHIEKPRTPPPGPKEAPRSPSASRHRHKTGHRRKQRKRSHSHTRKRKRERRSHDRKKSKRRHSNSRSRSKSPHRSHKRENSTEFDRKSKKTRGKSNENSSYTSSYESD